MAMLPEKVEHEAMADASPPLWMVVVAETLHDDWAFRCQSKHFSCWCS